MHIQCYIIYKYIIFTYIRFFYSFIQQGSIKLIKSESKDN